LEEMRPDAVLLQSDWMLVRLQGAGWRAGSGGVLVTLNRVEAPGCAALPGVVCNLRDIGREAMNLLGNLLQTGGLGLHARPPTLFIPGTWRE
jgi:hypothetical protein